MTTLEPRLRAVAGEIRSRTHADIGADHALLPKYLLQSGRAGRVIVVEKNQTPYENSRKALEGLSAEVRLGDGLGPLGAGEAESLSLTGMGAKLMVRILQAHPEKVPPRVVLQPNDDPEPLRRWALAAGLGLLNEQMVRGFWRYAILTFDRGAGDVYAGLPLEVALRFGPLLLRRKHPLLLEELQSRKAYLTGLLERSEIAKLRRELEAVEAALSFWK